MDEPIIYTWILIKKSDGKYLNKHVVTDMPLCGQPDLLKWYEWGKELPADIDTKDYIYDNGEWNKMYGALNGL